VANFLATLLDQYNEEMTRHRNRPFLRGVMAACALVATTGGTVSFPDRVRVDQILETLEALRVFDPHEGVDLFNEFAYAIKAHPAKGHREAVAAVCAAAAKPETAELMVRICLAVSEADGRVTLADQIEIVSLCSILGVEPLKFGLYREGAVDG